MKSYALVAALALFVTGCQSETVTTTAVESADVESTVVETTPVSFNVEGAPTAEMHVPDMMCQYSCVAKVKDVLASQMGVREVMVDFDTKKAIVAVDEMKFDAEAAVAALVDYQFSNTKLLAAEELLAADEQAATEEN